MHALDAAGLSPLHVPLIATEPVAHTLPAADVLVVSSATVFQHVQLPELPVAVVGEKTAAALRALGREPALVADNLASDLERRLAAVPGRHLHLRAEVVTRELGHEGVVVYRTVEPHVERLPDVDFITLASGSAARHLARLDHRGRIVCIGPTTARICAELGLEVAAVATPHTSEGLVAAVLALSQTS